MDFAKKCGPRAELEVWSEMVHVFHLFAFTCPVSRRAFGSLRVFLRRYLRGPLSWIPSCGDVFDDKRTPPLNQRFPRRASPQLQRRAPSEKVLAEESEVPPSANRGSFEEKGEGSDAKSEMYASTRLHHP